MGADERRVRRVSLWEDVTSSVTEPGRVDRLESRPLSVPPRQAVAGGDLAAGHSRYAWAPDYQQEKYSVGESKRRV